LLTNLLSRGLATAFRMQVIGSKENRNPVNLITNYSFLHVRHESLYYVALCKLNADASVVFEVIHKIIEILKAYFGGKLDEDTIKAHFILGQELLDGAIFTQGSLLIKVRNG
jgi:AP-2 complex subunit mu-1